MNSISSIGARNLTCQFPGVRALNDLTLEFPSGEIHALTGENGAGKSTLLKVLSGRTVPTLGQVTINGKSFPQVQHALSLGIRSIPQEPILAPDLSIAENLLMGRLPRKSFSRIDWNAAFDAAKDLLQKVGLAQLSPRGLVSGLGIAEQQLIEIARSLSGPGSVFLFDEPTSSLSAADVQRLEEILGALKAAGKIILYVSHRLDEIFSFCDRVSVLRDGNLVASKSVSETNPNELIRLMVGRELAPNKGGEPVARGSPLFEVSGLTLKGSFSDISFHLNRSEILGLAGLVGAGRTELLETLFGVRRAQSGHVSLNAQTLKMDSPRSAISAGLALVPEDRRLHGLALNLNIAENFALPNLPQLSSFGILRKRRRDRLAKSYAERLRLRFHSLNRQRAFLLSGGNQQKVVLGKWLAKDPKILLLDEPTRGIDVGTKSEIYSLIRTLTQQGISIILASSELAELLALSDRILVMREGQLAGELRGPEMTEEAIVRLATPGSAHQN